jgi:hypothetical protein
MLHFSRWKTLLIWFVVLVAVLIAAPNFLPSSQSGKPCRPGCLMRIVVVLGRRSEGWHARGLRDRARRYIAAATDRTVGDISRRLRQANIRYTGLTGNDQTVTVKITDPNQVQSAVDTLKDLTAATKERLVRRLDAECHASTGRGGELTFEIANASIDRAISAAQAQSIEVVSRRIAGLGNPDFIVKTEGAIASTCRFRQRRCRAAEERSQRTGQALGADDRRKHVRSAGDQRPLAGHIGGSLFARRSAGPLSRRSHRLHHQQPTSRRAVGGGCAGRYRLDQLPARRRGHQAAGGEDPAEYRPPSGDHLR